MILPIQVTILLFIYLLGDGHYSFSPDPTHQYNSIDLGTKAEVFYSEPYGNDSPDEYVFTGITSAVSNNTVPVHTLNNQIDLIRSWNPMQDENNYYVLRFENNQTAPFSGCVEFHYSTTDMAMTGIIDNYPNNWVTNQSLENSEYTSEGYDKKYKWTFSNLQPGEQRFVYLLSKCNLGPASLLDTRAVIKIDDCNKFYSSSDRQDGNENGVDDSEIYTLTSVVSTFPHDPNAIIANPQELCWEDFDQTIRYRYYFQNSGVDLVSEAEVAFYFDYPVESVTLVDASDDCSLEWFPANPPGFTLPKGKIIFSNIILPGSYMDPTPPTEETIGWVDVDVCFDLDFMTPLNMDCISSKIDIRFDNETDIPAFNEICRKQTCGTEHSVCSSVSETVQSFSYDEGAVVFHDLSEINKKSLNIFPNPASNLIRISWSFFNTKEEKQLRIIDLNGRILFHRTVEENSYMDLDILNFRSGTYIVELSSQNNLIIKRFVKL